MTRQIRIPSSRPSTLTQQLLERANIGRRYWAAEFGSIPPAPEKDALQKYLDSIHVQAHDGWGLFLWGSNGSGKSYAAACVLKAAIMNGYTAYTIMADELKVASIERKQFDEDTSVLGRLETVKFLLIEDIGKEYTTGSGFGELVLENLLRKRVRQSLVTIMTSNLTPREFGERYMESTASLLRESMIGIQITGDDHRRQLQKEHMTSFVKGDHATRRT